jgi:hypothetical protein
MPCSEAGSVASTGEKPLSRLDRSWGVAGWLRMRSLDGTLYRCLAGGSMLKRRLTGARLCPVLPCTECSRS